MDIPLDDIDSMSAHCGSIIFKQPVQLGDEEKYQVGRRMDPLANRLASKVRSGEYGFGDNPPWMENFVYV